MEEIKSLSNGVLINSSLKNNKRSSTCADMACEQPYPKRVRFNNDSSDDLNITYKEVDSEEIRHRKKIEHCKDLAIKILLAIYIEDKKQKLRENPMIMPNKVNPSLLETVRNVSESKKFWFNSLSTSTRLDFLDKTVYLFIFNSLPQLDMFFK